jgi:hypothetical protein
MSRNVTPMPVTAARDADYQVANTLVVILRLLMVRLILTASATFYYADRRASVPKTHIELPGQSGFPSCELLYIQ